MNNDDLNKNIDNKKLLEEIEELENDSSNEELNIKPKVSVKKENIIIIILIVIVLLGILCAYFSEIKETTNLEDFDNYLEDEDDSLYYYDYVDVEKEKFNNQKQNIIISQETLNINKDLVVAIKNQNDENITDLYVYVVFFDGENNIVGIDYTYVDLIKSNYEYYYAFEETPDNFERYDFFITKEYYSIDNDNLLDEQISYDVTEEDNYILINFKNNSKELIYEISFSIIYYNEEGKILDIQERCEFDIKSNSKGELRGYGIWDDETYEEIEYSSYEVILNYAIAN